MRYPTLISHLLMVCLLLFNQDVLRAQTPRPTPASTPPQMLTGPILPEAVAARKATIEAQLKVLSESNLPKESLDTTRAGLEQLFNVLTALEDAVQRRLTYRTQIDALPQRLDQLAQERQKLESPRPRRFPTVTEQLRDQYETQRQAIQAEVQELHQQTAAGEVRLAAIPKELEQRATTQLQLEKDLLVARGKTTKAGDQQPAEDIEFLTWKLQLLRAEVEALEVEREWLTKRGALQDALLSVAQVRLTVIRRDLATIKQTLSTAFQQEQSSLTSKAAKIEKKLERVAGPTEALRLTVTLETVEIRKHTATYRQQLNSLGDETLSQEKRNAQVKQAADRLTSLVEKYAGGEGIAQRLLVAFERLRRDRLRYNDTPVRAIETRLQSLTDQMFALDDRLYDFPHQAEARIAGLVAALQAIPAPQREANVTRIRPVLEDQKAALREQQQVLAALVQDRARLLALHRDYKRLLDDSYVFVLTQMFWLRDAKTLNWDVGRDVMIGAIGTVRRLRVLLGVPGSYIWARISGATYLWFLALLICLVLPWVLTRISRYLRGLRISALETSEAQNVLPGLGIAALTVIQAALWPAYLILVAWLLGYFLRYIPQQADLAMALVSGLQIGALVLGIGRLGRLMLQQDGWGQRFWALSPSLCRFLRRTVMVGCVAACVCLIPSHVVLTAPGKGDIATGSLALARVLSLGFQTVVLILLGIVGRRSSPLMDAVLARSRQRDGLLWRIWPIVYILLLAGVLGVIGLDVLGFRYAARFIWLRVLGSLSIVVTLRLLLVILVLHLLHRLINYIFSIGGRLRQLYPDVEEAAERCFAVLHTISNLLLIVLAVGIVLEFWGISVTWFATSAVGFQFLKRGAVILVALGVTVAVIQVSNAFTDYLIQPKTTVQGFVREPSRKLKTLAPLIQTLIKVGVLFAAVLVLLEQVSIATGPILTGVGIFGLAVGFASQSLIKDVINGLFILFEDSLSVGDVVTLRGITGIVEKVTLRAVTIRDLSGNVHIIPNSTIDMITNMTKEFSRYLLDVGIAYRENVDEVIPLLREIDEEMRADPEYGVDMLEPIDIMGLDRFEDSAVIIRTRLTTRPRRQWRIGREFNRRMKKVFDERGIEIPFPHRTLYWGTSNDKEVDVLHKQG